MAVRIRFKRLGRNQKPFYRLVAIEGKNSRDGKMIEVLGHYDPRKSPVYFEVKAERITHWMSLGAQPSDTVRRLLGDKGILPKVTKTPKEPGVSKKDKKARLETAKTE